MTSLGPAALLPIAATRRRDRMPTGVRSGGPGHLTRSAACLFGIYAYMSLHNAVAQGYPSKPLRIVVGSSPQGGTDTIARIIGTVLFEAMGQPVLVENRPGANGQIGATLVAKAPPDGYTLLMSATASMILQPLLSPKLPYQPARDFAPVTLVAQASYILSVHPSLPVKTVPDLIALARQRPGQITFASAGPHSISHLAGELFKLRTGVDMLHLAYKGGGPAALAILSGEASLMFGTAPTVVPHARNGKLRLVAIASPTRSKALPDLPTVGETVPGIVVSIWYGVQVPAGTPRDIVNRLHAEIGKAVGTDKVVRAIHAGGLDPVTSTPEGFGAFMRDELERWGGVVKAAGVVVQ